ncbi:MAG TPA: hypothetical protein VF109_08830 [Mycobacteriales bacterium]
MHVEGPETPAEIGGAVEAMTDELAGLDAAHPDLLDWSVGLAGDVVEVDLTVDAGTPEAAAALAVGAVRTAIHAAGGGTPGWEDTPPADAAVTYRLDEQSLRPIADRIPADA